MAVLNVTPDSFGSGGVVADVEAARRAVGEGADVLDIGGESTRPGAADVPVAEEMRRVLPVVEGAARLGVPVSIDTRNAVTARAALGAGASIVNDVSGLAHDPAMAAVVAEASCEVVLMHMRGDPRSMAALAVYADVVAEVRDALLARVAVAEAAGIARARIWLDPGLGFAKTPEHSVALLRRLDVLVALGFPVLVGASRKGFVGAMTGVADPRARVAGSVAVALHAAARGAAILRVHDVGATRQALDVWQTLGA